MSIVMTKPSLSEAQPLITEWQSLVDELLHDVESWVLTEHGEEWHINLSAKTIEEESLGRYEISMMEINTTDGRLFVEPVARDVIGARGRIDLYAWPSLFRVMLLRRSQSEEWVVRTDSGINWPVAWGESTFFSLAASLLKAE